MREKHELRKRPESDEIRVWYSCLSKLCAASNLSDDASATNIRSLARQKKPPHNMIPRVVNM